MTGILCILLCFCMTDEEPVMKKKAAKDGKKFTFACVFNCTGLQSATVLYIDCCVQRTTNRYEAGPHH